MALNTLVQTFAASLSLLASAAVWANYVPDTIELPASRPVSFPAHPALSLSNGGAIECWVAADWTNNPGYHPVILSNGDLDTPIYRLSIAADQQSLIVQAGSAFAQFSFNFADRQTHHIAVLDYDNEMVALIDGKFAGVVQASFEPGSLSDLYIGSTTGGRAPFLGAISAVRIWDIPLEPEEVAYFALRDPFSTQDPHPNLSALVGYSNFRESNFVVVDAVVVNETELLVVEE